MVAGIEELTDDEKAKLQEENQALKQSIQKLLDKRSSIQKCLQSTLQQLRDENDERYRKLFELEERVKNANKLNIELRSRLFELESIPRRLSEMEESTRILEEEIARAKKRRADEASSRGSNILKQSQQAAHSESPTNPSQSKPSSTQANVVDEDLGGILVSRNISQSTYDVKGGLPEKLIEWIFEVYGPATDYIGPFLLTYRSFTTPRELFRILSEKYVENLPKESSWTSLSALNMSESEDMDPNKKKRLKICNFFRHWCDKYFYDFAEDTSLLTDYWEWIDKKVSAYDGEVFAARLRSSLKKGKEGRKRARAEFTVPPPEPYYPKANPISSVFDIEAIEIARQLTLVEDEMYSKIHAKECLDYLKDKEQAANITEMIEQFNQVSGWVVESILAEENLRKRASCIEHWIKTADKCYELNNFNAVMEIISGLGNSAIHRLKRTWEKVPRARLKTFEDMKRFMSLGESQNNFKEYRKTVHSSNPPLVPYLGLYLTDLTFIDDGTTKHLANGYINFSKCRKIAQVIAEIQQYQQLPYNLKKVPSILEWFKTIQLHSKEAQYNRSLDIEPRLPKS